MSFLSLPTPNNMSEEAKYYLPGQYITPTYKLGSGEESNVVEKYIAGKGATISEIEVSNDGKTIPVIVSTLLGRLLIKQIKESKPSEEADSKSPTIKNFLVSVVPKTNSYIEYAREIEANDSIDSVSINLPQEGDVVLVRVTRLNLTQAFVEILSVEGFGNVIKDSGLGSIGEVAHKSLPVGGVAQALTSHTTIASSQSSQLNAQASDLGETFKGIIRVQDVRSTDRDKVQIIDSFRPGDIVRAQILSLGDGSNYYLTTARNDLGVIFARSDGGAGYLMHAIDWQTMICEKTGVTEARKCAKPF